MKNRYLFLALIIFALVLASILEKLDDLFLTYHYTSETTYYHVEISGTRISYIHPDKEKIGDRCSGWVAQTPCLTENDLIEETAQLQKQEEENLKRVINTEGFEYLDSE